MKKNLFLLVLLFVSTLITSCTDDETNDNNGINNSETKIITFAFDSTKVENEVVVGKPVIDDVKKIISFTVSNYASDEEIKGLIPTVTVSLGATVNPKSGVAADFAVADTVKYFVTSKDATSKVEYGVTCSRVSANIGIITFAFDPTKVENKIIVDEPVIDDVKKIISFTVSNSSTDAEIKALIPTVTVSKGATVNPKSGVAADFAVADTVEYVVTSKDATVKTAYDVVCSRVSANIGEELNNIFYKGSLSIELDGILVAEGVAQKIFITKTGDNLIKMELKNFSFAGMPIGDIVVADIAVVKTGNNHTIKGAQSLTLPVSPEPCDVSVEGTINGDVMDVNIVITKIPGISVILVNFKGDKMLVNQSSEAKITAFTFADAIVTGQPVIDGENITFVVSGDATPEQVKALVPNITISDKATISPVSGVATDFTNAVKYTVTSEDGIYQTVYTVSIGGKATVYSFDKWKEIWSKPDYFNPDPTYLYSEVEPVEILGSSNLGAHFLSLYGFKGGVNALEEATDVVSGSAAKLVTLDTRSIANAMVPGITSGTLFLGKFDVAFAFTNRLECTRFGLPFANKPLSFKGSYKYTAGAEFIDASNHENMVVVDGKKDECSITAVLFEVAAADEVLTGVDINTSDKRVAIAALADGTEKAEYTSFDVPFTYLEGKSFDPTKKYKITFVCSSSKEGDFFKGAVNSTLLIDQFEIIYEDAAPVE